MIADFCWMLKREHVMKGRKRKRNLLHRSFKDKKVRKSKRSKHTLPEKILHLRSYILIESPIDIPQFAFIEFPKSRGYTAEGLLFKA